MNEILAQALARGATILGGAIAGWLALHVPGINEAEATKLCIAIVSASFGWSTKHIADTAWFKRLTGADSSTKKEGD